MEKIMWLVLGGVAFVAALGDGQSWRALLVGRWALGVLFIVFGAVVNAIYLAVDPDYYEGFEDASPFPFVGDTLESLVAPHVSIFITVLSLPRQPQGRWSSAAAGATQIGLMALIGFHVGQLAFGAVLWVWAPLMLIALVLLLRAERQATTTRQTRPPMKRHVPA
jgi:hypothetical protein